MASQSVIVYGDGQSGNCYKVKLLLNLLGKPFEWIHVDILAGDSQTPAFLEKNANGKIPLLTLPDGSFLSESNAILNYLAHGTDYYSDDPFEAAKIQQWQFFEQYSHEPYIAVARFINKYLGLPDERRAEYQAKQTGGHKALSVMEQQLGKTRFLVGDRVTTADISLYGYTHVAHEGGFDLATYPHIQAWIQRLARLPGYIDMG